MHKIYLGKVVIGVLLSFTAIASYGANNTAVKQTGARQTPENAQQFIIKLAQKGALTHQVQSRWGWNVGGVVTRVESLRDKTFTHQFPPDHIKSVSALGKCQTSLDYDSPKSVHTNPPGYGSIAHPLWYDTKIIHWKYVTEVKQVYTSVEWTQQNIVRSFDVSSTDLAARLAYAMEFLRLSCDDTADTGF